jgi:hypothetical protein
VPAGCESAEARIVRVLIRLCSSRASWGFGQRNNKEQRMAVTEQGLAKEADLRDETRMARLTGSNIKTAQELRQRIEEIQQHAFVLSPMSAVSAIAPGYEITPVVVVIDASVDPVSGRGADVYHQSSIHKGKKIDGDWVPLEVSLNHYGLLKILGAVGVNVYPTRWQYDGVSERYLWVCETDGDVIDFDGRVRRLPTGIGSLDARDGSPDIGEWTPEEWQKRVDVANKQREKTTEKDRWKVKPEALAGGWTAERVMNVRKFGRQLAKTKSLNGLARKLGVRQVYTIEELKKKPFIIMRPMFMPDMSNPRIAEMVTAANLGARHTLYPGATAPQETPMHIDAPVSHGHGEPQQTLTGEVVEQVQEEPERMKTAAPPQDAEEVVDAPPPVEKKADAPAAADVFHIVKLLRKGKANDPTAQYFVETKEGVTLFTPDANLLKPLQAAAKDGQPREIQTERVMVADQPYRQIVEMTAAGGLKL